MSLSSKPFHVGNRSIGDPESSFCFLCPPVCRDSLRNLVSSVWAEPEMPLPIVVLFSVLYLEIV